MEFLVRLEDKVNTQVFCYNPVHGISSRERVSFRDETHRAACPGCGKVKWLWRKNNQIPKKGTFITFKPDGWSWGRNELKHFGVARIDCTYEQAAIWCEVVRDQQAEANVVHTDMMHRQAIAELVKGGMPIREATGDETVRSLKRDYVHAVHVAMIARRFRRWALDFEKVLTLSQLATWNDMDMFSEIVTISEQDKIHIREIQWR